MLQEISQLLHGDRFKPLSFQIVQQVGDVFGFNLKRVVDFPIGDRMKHNRHDHRARSGVVGIPFIAQILARVADIRLGNILWVQETGLIRRR